MGLEPLEDVGSRLVILYFYTPTGKPTGCTFLPGSPGKFWKIPGDPDRPVQPVGLPVGV